MLLNLKQSIQAGVRGQIVGLVGSFYECGKKGKPKSHIKIYELQIDELFKKWPNKKKRERRWVMHNSRSIHIKSLTHYF